ncbi:MAG: Rhodanese- sulfurtransferase [Claussenomyces sp. TS43310]|nr:MAG: Rhodanese- sulfurtransferase [Claussenomyces sp. TS43310]
MAEANQRSRLPVVVNKPTPYTFDLGLLLANDPNPLERNGALEEDLAATARDGAQALLNQLLSTCPITSTPAGVLLTLPAVHTALPRQKPLPPPKTETTWSRFAAKKGIKPKTAAARQKMQYDEETGEWVPKWGYKGANKEGEGDWIVEVDEKKERERKLAGKGVDGSGMTLGAEGRTQRKERIKRQDRLQRANQRKGRRSENYVGRK